MFSFLSFLQVFGRGGEEMDFLQQQGIRVEVIPGMELQERNLFFPGMVSIYTPANHKIYHI